MDEDSGDTKDDVKRPASDRPDVKKKLDELTAAEKDCSKFCRRADCVFSR